MAENLDKERCYYVSSMLEQYRVEKGLDSAVLNQMAAEYCLFEWLYDNYCVLHTQDNRATIMDMEEWIEME